ncbi:MAG TPA: serine hydrolase domain-containing protein [Candidatus Polarisedimenticolia bacterium]|nr:serine hydrolase domain-containing protein [Candidatus Polarisedimenticolia bacterium]
MSPATAGASTLDDWLAEKIREDWFPGASWLVGDGRRVLFEGAVGDATIAPGRIAASISTLYDLASLTKPLATALLAVRLQTAGLLRLEDRVDRLLPEWRPRDAAPALTVLDLLTHRSGLPAWMPLYALASDVPGRIAAIASAPRPHAPLVAVTYSCPNYLLAGFALERVSGAPLDRLFRDQVTGPLGIADVAYRPDPAERPRIAATETGNAHERALAGPPAAGYNAFRRDLIWGEVHDHNAWTLGGVAGNAGLFGTARAVWSLARLFLKEGPSFLGNEERSWFSHDFTPGLNQARGVGFQLASTVGCSAGPDLSPRAFGHTGFTGTSLWIDPEAERVLVLLTNRVHPRHRDRDLHPLRREFHTRALTL